MKLLQSLNRFILTLIDISKSKEYITTLFYYENCCNLVEIDFNENVLFKLGKTARDYNLFTISYRMLI